MFVQRDQYLTARLIADQLNLNRDYRAYAKMFPKNLNNIKGCRMHTHSEMPECIHSD
jgi:hypothetical protein